MQETFTIINHTKDDLPNVGLPFEVAKDEVLGKDFELELVFVDLEESKELNKIYKGKDKPTNILSFPLDKNSGQIFICPEYAEKEAPDFGRKFENYIAFLFIHGLVHLKGMDHGSTMDGEEQKIRSKFGV